MRDGLEGGEYPPPQQADWRQDTVNGVVVDPVNSLRYLNFFRIKQQEVSIPLRPVVDHSLINGAITASLAAVQEPHTALGATTAQQASARADIALAALTTATPAVQPAG